MFRVVRNELYEETAVLPRCLEILAAALPDTWDLKVADSGDSARRFPDAVATIRPPGGSTIALAIEAKAAPLRTNTIAHLAATFEGTQGIPCLFAEYVPPSTRQAMDKLGLSGVDTTGWVHILSHEPPVLIDREGASRAPRVPRNERIERLNGASTGRVLRYLVTATLPRGIREIAADCQVSPGTVSKLLPTLEREGITAPRSPREPLRSVNRADLIDRWAQDHSLAKSNAQVLSYFDPRGMHHATEAVGSDDRTVLTGVHGGLAYLADGQTPVVSGKQLTAYCDDPQRIAREANLYPVDKSRAHVLLVVPRDPDLLQRTRFSHKANGWVAPLGQVLVDLKSLPGREADLADQIIDSLSRVDPDTDSGWTVWAEKKGAETH